MSVVVIDTASPIPPFEQVRTQVAAMVADGRLPAGAKLPTVRQMAADLGLAANTVARAYRELETDGVIATHGRRGTFVHSDALDAGPASPTPITEAATHYAALARKAGLSIPEAIRLVEQAWS